MSLYHTLNSICRWAAEQNKTGIRIGTVEQLAPLVICFNADLRLQSASLCYTKTAAQELENNIWQVGDKVIVLQDGGCYLLLERSG